MQVQAPSKRHKMVRREASGANNIWTLGSLLFPQFASLNVSEKLREHVAYLGRVMVPIRKRKKLPSQVTHAYHTRAGSHVQRSSFVDEGA